MLGRHVDTSSSCTEKDECFTNAQKYLFLHYLSCHKEEVNDSATVALKQYMSTRVIDLDDTDNEVEDVDATPNISKLTDLNNNLNDDGINNSEHLNINEVEVL